MFVAVLGWTLQTTEKVKHWTCQRDFAKRTRALVIGSEVCLAFSSNGAKTNQGSSSLTYTETCKKVATQKPLKTAAGGDTTTLLEEVDAPRQAANLKQALVLEVMNFAFV